jgi:hypothetical protein
MLIECTFCHAQAKLPDSKEGAKVKCGSCGKVYVARDPNSRGTRKTSSPTPYIIGGAGVVGIAVIAFIATRSSTPRAAPPPPPPKVEEPVVDRVGWDSEFVKVVRGIYDAAYASNAIKLQGSIHLARHVEHLRTTPAGANVRPLAEMTAVDKDDLLKAVVETWLEGESDQSLAVWKPYDGKVQRETETDLEVRMEVGGRAAPYDTENRFYDWKLALDRDGRWKAWSWERYISPDEVRSAKSALSKEITVVKLDDGTRLYQADPRPLPHLDDTPPEMRTRIDAAVEKLLDTSLRAKEVTKVRQELLDIGKPALPILLTKMYEIKIVDDDTLIRVTQVHGMLKDITGYDKAGFSPLGVGPESEKRREIAIKAWFAWYLRKGERFEERAEGPDALEGLVKPNEKDKREIEKAKKQADG